VDIFLPQAPDEADVVTRARCYAEKEDPTKRVDNDKSQLKSSDSVSSVRSHVGLVRSCLQAQVICWPRSRPDRDLHPSADRRSSRAVVLVGIQTSCKQQATRAAPSWPLVLLAYSSSSRGKQHAHDSYAMLHQLPPRPREQEHSYASHR